MPAATPPERGLRTVAEAATRLGLTKATVYEWVAAGRLPAVRLGSRALRIRETDLARIEETGLAAA